MTRTETGWCVDCGVEVGPYHHDGGIGRCDQCAREQREQQRLDDEMRGMVCPLGHMSESISIPETDEHICRTCDPWAFDGATSIEEVIERWRERNPLPPREYGYVAELDYDLIAIRVRDEAVSINPHAIGSIKVSHTDVADWYVRIKDFNGNTLAWFAMDTQQDADEWHAHLHNLWRDARIVAGRAK